MGSKVLVVRADASVAMGTGHVMRCLALAQAWQDAGGGVIFAMAESTPAVEERLDSERMEVVKLNGLAGSVQDAAQLSELAHSRGADWLVADGYQFDAEFQQRVRVAGLQLLFIDDTAHAADYVADLVLNQNAHASESLYRSRGAHVQLLLGPRYALLRHEFKSWQAWKREINPVARRVLVTMGGSDPDNTTALVIRALQMVGIDGLEVRVVVGGSNPHMKSLEAAASQSVVYVSLVRNPANIPELMAWADVAVSAAGTTCWEMCLLGLPAILLGLAPNQRPVAQELDRRGIAFHLDCPDLSPEQIAEKLKGLLASLDTRAAMSRRGRELVDGRGAERVVSAMRGGDLRLRRVEESDCLLLWEWANEPAVRAVSFSSETIPWEQHLKWFNSKLTDSDAVLYLATSTNNVPVGQVRYQLEGTRAVVSISLAPGYRGKGNGKMALSSANAELFRKTRATTIDAYVKPHNRAALQLFHHAGFRQEAPAVIRGQQAIHFVLTKNGTL